MKQAKGENVYLKIENKIMVNLNLIFFFNILG